MMCAQNFNFCSVISRNGFLLFRFIFYISGRNCSGKNNFPTVFQQAKIQREGGRQLPSYSSASFSLSEVVFLSESFLPSSKSYVRFSVSLPHYFPLSLPALFSHLMLWFSLCLCARLIIVCLSVCLSVCSNVIDLSVVSSAGGAAAETTHIAAAAAATVSDVTTPIYEHCGPPASSPSSSSSAAAAVERPVPRPRSSYGKYHLENIKNINAESKHPPNDNAD